MKRIAALTLSLLSVAAVAAYAADSTAKINGWISDSMCGAKHAGTGASCAKKCIEGGSKPVFVDEAKKEVWAIDNPDAVKEAYGKHVAITATADAATKSVHVTGVSVIAE
jgi:type 1 fimbria pilin